ncbi:MAG: hypothetical protein FWF15_11260 [Oscillospiraceae bacterium]|nr:hypothetical protein [Oscillospiraceae bacterium]
MKKVLILILILLAVVLISCGTPDSGTTKNESTNDTVLADIETESAVIIPDLPDMDLKGETFMFYVMGYERNINNYSVEIYAEAETGDVINDAVYRRNRTIEDRYNFEVEEYPESNTSLSASVRKVLLAGDNVYQVLMMNLIDSVSILNDGLLHNLKKVEYIDLNKPWWDKSNEGFSICNKLYFAVGDINIMDNNATWSFFFNKKMINNLNLESPYTYVENNEWIYDIYYELACAGAKDLNGDGVMDPDNDQWGSVGQVFNTFIIFTGSGERLTSKDKDDNPYLVPMNTRTASVIDKVLDIQLDKQVHVYADEHSGKYANVYDNMIRRNFKEDRALFYIAGLLSYTLLRDMESEFGVVPVPKYESSQENYYVTYSHSNASALSIPITNMRLSETGLVVEALSAESMYTLTPAYFDVALERKYMRDEESRAMLEIILSSRTYDLMMVYNWGGAFDILNNLTLRNSKNFTSEFDKVKEKTELEITKTIEKINSFE